MKRAIAAIAALAVALAIAATVGTTQAGAAAAPQATRPVRTVTIHTYGSNALQTVTVYSTSQPNKTSVVMIHGGGFRSSALDAKNMATDANKLGSYGDTVFVVNYRDDTSGVGIADQVADVVNGTKWVINHASGYGANPHYLTILGGSSGGLLAGDAAEELNSAHKGTVRTVITLSGTEDFSTALAYWSAYPGSVGKQHMKDLTGTLGCPSTGVGCSKTLEKQYSPDQHVTKGHCASHWLIFNGDHEQQPTSQATAMDHALIAAGCAQTLDIFADTAHAFDYWHVVLPKIEQAIAAS
jgi:acetyl esterase/lipase